MKKKLTFLALILLLIGLISFAYVQKEEVHRGVLIWEENAICSRI